MTLIFCLANEDCTVLVSDRRRSFKGHPPDEESNKALVLNLFDARLAVAFTGLASTETFETRLWLAEALSEAARPEPLVQPTMARFCDIASRDIKNVALSAQDDPSDRRLTIFAAGYQYLDEGSRAWYFRVSNFEGEELYSKPKQLPDDDFSLVWARQQTPTTTPYGFVVAGGTTRGIPSSSMLQLRRLVAERRPPGALVDKAVEVIQAAADAQASGEKVGKQCTSIVLPQDPTKPGQVEYHSANLARQVFLPDYIRTYEAQDGGYGALIIRSEGFALEDEAGDKIIVQVPKVGRNWPCPCGSGRKYKQCHGNRQEPGWRVQLGGSGDDQHRQDAGDASGSETPH